MNHGQRRSCFSSGRAVTQAVQTSQQVVTHSDARIYHSHWRQRCSCSLLYEHVRISNHRQSLVCWNLLLLLQHDIVRLIRVGNNKPIVAAKPRSQSVFDIITDASACSRYQQPSADSMCQPKISIFHNEINIAFHLDFDVAETVELIMTYWILSIGQ